MYVCMCVDVSARVDMNACLSVCAHECACTGRRRHLRPHQLHKCDVRVDYVFKCLRIHVVFEGQRDWCARRHVLLCALYVYRRNWRWWQECVCWRRSRQAYTRSFASTVQTSMCERMGFWLVPRRTCSECRTTMLMLESLLTCTPTRT